ncbi:MAG TPA: FemAB family XrtA/PEP-CTERM system-associated protein [Longimicrobiales bacterium]|nr:FemAB family XrtA/PEP-CTERM system-associated protein [Longimicrobiales bacterium]
MRHALRVEPFPDDAGPRWDARVRALDGSTLAHPWGWREVMEDVLGHETLYLHAVDDAGATAGVLPLVHVKSRLFGDYLLSMPFLSYGGPLGPEAARGALAARAVEEARARGVDLMELRARARVPGDLAVSDRKLTVLLPLVDSAETLWEKGLRAKVRSQVRRPMKEGMTARFGPELVEPFYDVFAHTMRDLGTPVLGKRFFERLVRVFPDEVVFAVVEHRGAAAAAGCGFLWNGELEITWAGARRELSRQAPNMLLYWSLMEEAICRGAHTFNFGRCSPGSGTHRFKRQWGGEDVPLPWAQWSPTGVAATPSPDGARYRLATAVWSRLPVPLTRALGPLLSRSLP